MTTKDEKQHSAAKQQQQNSEKEKQAATNAQSKAHAADQDTQREKTRKADRIADPNAVKGSASDGDTTS